MGWLQIETVFDHVNIEQYDTSLHVVIQMKANKLFLDVIAVFFRFIQFLGGQTIFDISSTQPFYYKEVVELITFDHFSSRASTANKTCSHRPTFQNQFPDQRVKGVMRTSGGIDFRFRLNLKTFSGIDISQPTPSMSLSVPSFSLDPADHAEFFCQITHQG